MVNIMLESSGSMQMKYYSWRDAGDSQASLSVFAFNIRIEMMVNIKLGKAEVFSINAN